MAALASPPIEPVTELLNPNDFGSAPLPKIFLEAPPKETTSSGGGGTLASGFVS